MKKILSYNLLFFLALLILIELIFGYWFDEDNFGVHMRKHRNRYELYETKYNNKEYRFIYKRNFYGFRGEETKDLSKIKYVFLGGSTGNERFLPENLTIIGKLNQKFINNKKKIKIINASVDGKTLNGHINDFKYWFPKLNNFKPKYFIIYSGINDSVFDQPKKYDRTYDENFLKNIRDYITNNSITVDLIKKVKWKYFSNIKLKYDMNNINLYNNFQYFDYNKAIELYDLDILKNKYKLLHDRYLKRLENILIEVFNWNAQIIFITQIKFNGIEDEKLFLLNEILKDFANKNKIKVIKLDEIYQGELNDFYDTVHTSPKGNEKISNILYFHLNKIIP